MIPIATKSASTIKNVAHLTIGIKCNVSFMKNDSFYETKFNHFSSHIEKICTFSFLTSIFTQISNLKMQTYFVFQALYDLKFSIALSKFKKFILEKCF